MNVIKLPEYPIMNILNLDNLSITYLSNMCYFYKEDRKQEKHFGRHTLNIVRICTTCRLLNRFAFDPLNALTFNAM